MIDLFLAAAAAVTPPLRGELEPLRFLIGHCWRGSRPGGAVDTHCFDSVYSGQHVRDRHKVPGASGDYEGETLYSWNAKAARIDYVYWNSLGDVLTGDAASDGARGLKFNQGAIAWRRVSDDAYEVAQAGRPAIRFQRID